MFTKLPESTARMSITETARNTRSNSVTKYSCKSAYQSRKSVTLIQLKTGTKYITLLESNIYIYIYIYIQGVPGGKDLTSGECSLGQTIPI